MLINLKEILAIAEEKKCAIGAFNTPNLEALIAVISAAEEGGDPVIINHAQVHEGFAPLDIIGPIMVEAAKRAKVPVCVNLDHGEDLEYIERALKIGFTSVMFDGSVLSYEDNVAATKKAVAMAAKYGASVEGEVGVMTRREGDVEAVDEKENNGDASMYTDPDMAVDFVEKTGIDALACSFGTAHGIYLTEPKLDFERLAKINQLTNLPIVMHGGSGVSEEDYRRVIENGVRKINYYTYMAKAGAVSVKEKIDSLSFYHEIVSCAIVGMKNNVRAAMDVFLGKNS